VRRSKAQQLFYAILFLGLVLSGIKIGQFIGQNGLPQIGGLLTSQFWLAVGLAVGLQLLGHYLRAWKWRLLLQPVRPVRVRTLVRGLAVGFLFNSLLPFRLGEFIRAHVVGESMAISRTVVFCTILVERSLDGVILGLAALGLAAVLLWGGGAVVAGFWYLGAVLLAGSLAAMALLWLLNNQDARLRRVIYTATGWLNDRLRDQVRQVLWSAIYGLNFIGSRTRPGLYVLVSAAMWLVYALSLWWLVIAILPALPWLEQLTLSVLAYASLAIPSGPAYLGTFQQALTSAGQSLTANANGLLVLAACGWLVLIAPVSVIGLVALPFGPRRRPAESTSVAEVMKNKLYRESGPSAELSHFLDAYFAGAEINQVLHDYETRGDFRLVQTFKGGSNAITLLGWAGGELVVKKIILPQYADKLRAQYQWIDERKHLPHMPAPRGQEETPDYYAISISYRQNYQPFFDFIHAQPVERSQAIVNDLVAFMYDHVYQPAQAAHTRKTLESYIATKLIDKVADTARMDPQVASLLEAPQLEVNGVMYVNFTQIIGRIQAREDIMAELSQFEDTPIHGDLTIDNVIVSAASGNYILLDPNNENQVSDPVVDLAKMYQSLHSGYEFLCQLESATVAGQHIQFPEQTSSKYGQLFAGFDTELRRRLEPAAYRSLLFHEAAHYCRMLTYRAKINPSSLPVFYGVAVRLLNEFYNQYETS
jgi:uncharacterized protein (TIRG00374 family)